MQTVPTKPTTQGPRTAGRMTLAAVQSGRVDKPVRVVCYGVEGIGKSTFGAGAPAPIFLGAEDGTAHLDVARFPEPQSWTDALEAIDVLSTQEHSYKSLVVDTLDWLEPLCWANVCRVGKKDSIEDFGYGKGYAAALDNWRVLLARLDRMRAARGMHVVLLAHSWIKGWKNPEGDDYDRYELKLHSKTSGLVKEWADAVLFARYETYAVENEKAGRTKGISTGARILHTQHRAAWDAKNRFDLPETLPLAWSEFAAAMKAHAPATPERLRQQIEELLPQLDEKTRASVTGWLPTVAENAAELARGLDKLRGIVLTTAV
jgi:NAD(P)H-dependent FMN reductase